MDAENKQITCFPFYIIPEEKKTTLPLFHRQNFSLVSNQALAETWTLFFSTSSSGCIPLFKEASTYFPIRRFHHPQSRSFHFTVKSSRDDGFGLYPWADSSIQWVSEERVTLFTTDGMVQIGGNLVSRRVFSADKKQGKIKLTQRPQRYQESNYMDPNQSLCLSALFDIAATNGLHIGRRLCLFGFCHSIEMLCDVVEDTVLENGGEVVTAEKASKEGLHEKLTMTVAVPLLWGVPPTSETLRFAMRSGGGIVDKVYWQWDFL